MTAQEIQDKFNNECMKGVHDYITITSVDIGYDEDVVYEWCRTCGSWIRLNATDNRIMRKSDLYVSLVSKLVPRENKEKENESIEQ